MISYKSIVHNVQTNWKPGLTVALVSIPLSISLAVVSGVSPTAGIITAIWAGLIASLFGGSNYNIIGPTGALSGLIVSYAIIHGPQAVSMLAIATGFFILCAYIVRLERYLIFIPSSVIHGFTLGVALIIGLNQLNFALGLKPTVHHEHFFENIIESWHVIGNISWPTFLIFCIFFASILMFKILIKSLPPALVITPFGLALGYLDYAGIIALNLETLGSKFGDIVPHIIQKPYFFMSSSLISAGMVIALIAILETMLSAKIADGMTRTKHNSRKEMLGLGLANIGSGLLGGIPATAALARTAFNIKNGATNKMSATLCSIFIALGSLLFLRFFTYMPMVVIAALLVNIAMNMIEREHFDRLLRHDKINFAIALLVAFFTVYKDPIVGILIGAVLSLLVLVNALSEGYYETSTHADDGQQATSTDHTLIYAFKGKLAYINGQSHVVRFETGFEDYKTIVLSLRDVYFIDIDGIDMLDEIIEIVQKRNQRVVIVDVPPHIQTLLMSSSHKFHELQSQNLVLSDIAQIMK